ncbi:MAG: acyl-CoA synthetase [Myxococcota bacterium]
MTKEYVGKLFHHLESPSDEIAFELGDDALTWSELDMRSRRYAAGLRELGLEQGDRVAAILETSLDMVVALLGHYRLGLVHVPVNTQYREVEVAHILADSEARAVITDRGTPSDEVVDALDLPDTLDHRIVIGGAEGALSFDGLCEAQPLLGEPPCEDDDLALFIYTSGTTGKSKGVMHTYRSVLSNIDNLTSHWRWTQDDHQVLALPLFHVHGLCIGVHGTLLRGCRTELHAHFDATAVAEAIGAGGTIFMGVPTMHTRLLRLMEEHPAMAEKLKTARLFTSGSAALPVQVFEGYEKHTGQRILERYGMSETMLTISNPYDGERRAGTVGFAVPGCEIRIVDEDFEDVDTEEVGQILVRGDSVMRGYWKQPERTEDAFHNGWFITGDVARRDEDGYIAIVGRMSVDIIKSGGYKISAREIEEVLLDHPSIEDIGVVGVPDEEWGERIAAAVILRDGHENPGEAALLDDLQAFASEALASYKKIREAIVLDELPRNALGKVQKHRIVEQLEGRS